MNVLVHRPGDADALLVVLHGYDDPPGLLPTALRARLLEPGWALAVPEGPTRTAAGGRAWFASTPDDHGPSLGAALDDLSRATDAARAELGLAAAAVTVLGWSQGAAAALAWAARRATDDSAFRPLDVVALAAWLPDGPEPGRADQGWDLAVAGALGVRATLVHGVDDEVVPLPLGRGAARVLERHGVAVDWYEVACGHDLPPLLDVAWGSRDRAR